MEWSWKGRVGNLNVQPKIDITRGKASTQICPKLLLKKMYKGQPLVVVGGALLIPTHPVNSFLKYLSEISRESCLVSA